MAASSSNLTAPCFNSMSLSRDKQPHFWNPAPPSLLTEALARVYIESGFCNTATEGTAQRNIHGSRTLRRSS